MTNSKVVGDEGLNGFNNAVFNIPTAEVTGTTLDVNGTEDDNFTVVLTFEKVNGCVNVRLSLRAKLATTPLEKTTLQLGAAASEIEATVVGQDNALEEVVS